jgi:hypothetical protein
LKSKLRLVTGLKEEIERQIEDVNFDNRNLMEFRKQRQSIGIVADEESRDSSTGFYTIPAAHKAFETLGRTLVTTWSCDDSQHTIHAMCLNLNVDVSSGGCTCSNLVLKYEESSQSGQQGVGNKASRPLLLEAMKTDKGKRQALGFKKGTSTMCEHLTKCICAGDLLLGRLNTLPNNHQANLYHGKKRCAELKAQAPVTKEVRLNEVLAWFQDPLDMYELALTLVTAVLHLHATPWLPDAWRLSSIAALHADEPSDTIQSLSVAMPLCAVAPGTAVDPKQSFDDYCNYGVVNTTLFMLGIALLEIELGKPLEAYKNDKNESDVFTARKMAKKPGTNGGLRYRKLAEKCLNCNFGCDVNDLADEEFQEAVYGGVVHKLKELVATG